MNTANMAEIIEKRRIVGKECATMSAKEKTMDIVMLAAGTSSRMGRTNKMLLPYNGMSMVCHCCLEALKFLQDYSDKNDEECTLIVVTGYKSSSVEKALAPCKAFMEKTDARLEMLIVNNPDYKKGQFSSTKTGVAQVKQDSPFFISLADMPLVSSEHYTALVPLLKDHDAVRPFYEDAGQRLPGHPVLHAFRLRDAMLKCPDTCKVSLFLGKYNVCEPSFSDSSWTADVDVAGDYKSIIGS